MILEREPEDEHSFHINSLEDIGLPDLVFPGEKVGGTASASPKKTKVGKKGSLKSVKTTVLDSETIAAAGEAQDANLAYPACRYHKSYAPKIIFIPSESVLLRLMRACCLSRDLGTTVYGAITKETN